MDKIEIRDLEIFANHGVFPEETALGQKFVVSAVMYTETRPAGLADDLSASINYGEVSHMITDFLQKNTYKLLEAAVENLAELLLLSLPLLKKITLRIEKPWAPVGLPLKTVAVEITRGWHTAYVAFGSNMGDKKKYLDNAIQGLRDMKEIVVEKVSEYLVTEPYGGVEQDEFLNGALRVRTLLCPDELLDRLHVLEQAADRKRIIHWGPRTLDLDILFYDNEIIDTENVRLILGTDEECGSSDITHYYSVEKEAPMTFSPDASFPVINIEKGRIGGNFTAEFEPSDRLPKMVSFHSGTKTNVVPGAAEALFEGLDGDETGALAKSMEEELGIRFTVSSEDGCLKIAAAGENGHAMAPWKGKNALTGLLSLIERLPLAECGQVKTVRALNRLMPHGDWYGEALGIKMSDEESGELTLAFSMLDISEKSLEGEFDSRCPICATKENTIDVIREKMEADGISFNTEEMKPPHHVPADSDFVKTLLSAYEKYSGRKGECIAIGGGTYVHNLKNGVAFGAALPETENHMHGPDEFAVVDELTMSAKIFAQVIVDLCC